MLFIFVFCALFGWVYETIVYAIRRRKFVFRGFLVGPFLPIYGFGGVMILVAAHDTTASPLAIFLIGMAATTLLEYLTAVFLELVFKMSWWDYDWLRFNYKGRIALLTSLAFGLATLLAVYVVWPIAKDWDAKVFERFGYMPYIVFLIYITIDAIFSFIHVARFRAYANRVKKSWKKDGELDTAKYMRFLYREVRDHSPFYSIRKLVFRTAPDHLKELFENQRKPKPAKGRGKPE